MPDLDDVRAIVASLPGAEERMMSRGPSWFVRNKPFAWECHPYPSIPEHLNDIIGRELVLGVKIGDPIEARALREMEPDVFLGQTTMWSEPKIALRMGAVDPQHLAELVTEAWYLQAPKYLRAQFEASVEG